MKNLIRLIGLASVLVVGIGFVWMMIGRPSPAEIGTIVPKGIRIGALTFSQDDEFIIVGSNSFSNVFSPEQFQSELSIWKMSDLTKWKAIDMPHHVTGFSMDKMGKFLAVTVGGPKVGTKEWKNDGKPRQVRVYSFPEMKEIHRLEKDDYLRSAVLSPDGSLLAAIVDFDEPGTPPQIIVWDTASWKIVYTISELTCRTTPDIRFSPDGKLLGVFDCKQTGHPVQAIDPHIRLHVASTGKLKSVVALSRLNRRSYPKYFDFLANDRLIVDCDRVISTWGADGVEGEEIPVEPRTSRVISLSRDRKVLMVANSTLYGTPRRPSHVLLWDVDAKKVLHQWDRPGYGPIAMTADKKKLAVGTDKVYLFDLK